MLVTIEKQRLWREKYWLIEINLSLNTMKKMVSPQKNGFLRKEIAHAKCTIIEKQ